MVCRSLLVGTINIGALIMPLLLGDHYLRNYTVISLTSTKNKDKERGKSLTATEATRLLTPVFHSRVFYAKSRGFPTFTITLWGAISARLHC